MGFAKPTIQVDWINDDSATKYTIPSAGDQLAGHLSGTNADPKIFNWMWWRVSQWIEFLDNTFDSNGNEVNAPNSTKITETVSPTASTVTLDAGGIKSWDGSSNAIFSVTEAGVVTFGYSGNDIISLNAGVISVCTATSADLVKLHALTPSAADLNKLLGADGNGLVVADITKLANIDASDTDIDVLNGSNAYGLVVSDIQKLADIDASAAEIDQLDGVSVGGNSSGDILTTDDTQTVTGKSIAFSQITSGNVSAGVDCGFTGNDSDPATLKFGNMAGYHANITNKTDGTLFTIAPSANNQIDYRLSVSGASVFKTITEESVGNFNITTSATLDLNAVNVDLDASANIDLTGGGDHYAKVCAGNDSAGNNYAAITVNYSDNGTIVFDNRVNTSTGSVTFTPTAFYPVGTIDVGASGNRFATIYGSNLNITSSSGDAITINDSAADGLQIGDWAASNSGIHITLPGASTTRGQLCFDSTGTAIATAYSNASGGELAAYNNSGTIELWWHDGTSWAKIS